MPKAGDQTPKQAFWPRLTYRWLIWAVFVAVWTAGLLYPAPKFPFKTEVNVKFFVMKGMHVSAYAAMAVLSAWLHVPSRYRWLLMFFMAAHAAGTEFAQLYVPGRSGLVSDVGLDLIGVSLGCAVTWRWWCEPGP